MGEAERMNAGVRAEAALTKCSPVQQGMQKEWMGDGKLAFL